MASQGIDLVVENKIGYHWKPDNENPTWKEESGTNLRKKFADLVTNSRVVDMYIKVDGSWVRMPF